MMCEIYEDEFVTAVNDNIKLIQKKRGLTFGTDALLLAAFIHAKPYGAAVDLGSGSGIISLLCASRGKFKSISAVEIQPTYADLIKRNAESNGLDGIVSPLCADVRDITADKSYSGTVDTVFSNPPFLKNTSGLHNPDEEKNIARREICGTLNDFCAAAARLLKWGGSFYFVYRPERLADMIGALRENKLEPKKMSLVLPDERHPPCLIMIEAKKGGLPDLKITKPLFLSFLGKASEEAQFIYESGNWYE